MLPVEDRLAITELFARMAYYYDEGHLDALEASFAKNAVMSMQICGGDIVGPFEGRENIMVLYRNAKSNQNDVIKIIGKPHTVSLKDENTWIYFERAIGKGKILKLGQNVLRSNNILELKFNKYGILSAKQLFKKEDMNRVKYSTKITKNEVSQRGFVDKFLSSIRQKMYGKKKF